jgi:hypothetical protein
MDEEQMQVHSEAFKDATIKAFNMTPETYEATARYAQLMQDKNKIMGALKTEIAGSGKLSDVHQMLAKKHNDHAYDLLKEQIAISGPLGAFCTCEDHEMKCFNDVLIPSSITKPEEIVQEEGLLGLTEQAPLDLTEEPRHALSDFEAFAKLGA